MVAAGKVRLDRQSLKKPARLVGLENVLTFVQGQRLCEVQILACGDRRGSASEAQKLYVDISTHAEHTSQNPVFDRKGRPGKRERRNATMYDEVNDSFGLE